MQLPRSQALAAELIWLNEAGSTNDVLRQTVVEHPGQADRTVVATDNQTAGRGRLGREWIAPPGQTLALSVLVRGFANGFGDARDGDVGIGASWLPLIAGSAVRRALAGFLPEHPLGVKWPNDVLVAQQKISGILCEMLPDGSVIVGVGINTLLEQEALPTSTATSLRVLFDGGKDADQASLAEVNDRVLSAVLTELFTMLDLVTAGEHETVRSMITGDSATLGTTVRALLPNGDVVEGEALRLTPDGALVIATATTGHTDAREVVVAAGDIQHLR